MKARGFVVSERGGEPQAGVAVLAVWCQDGEQRPAGLLVSDDAGYVSFDLADREATGELRLEVLEDGASANGDGRRGATVRVARDGDGRAPVGGDPVVLTVDPATVRRPSPVTRPSVQAPDARDWELSPTSFVTPRKID